MFTILKKTFAIAGAYQSFDENDPEYGIVDIEFDDGRISTVEAWRDGGHIEVVRTQNNGFYFIR